MAEGSLRRSGWPVATLPGDDSEPPVLRQLDGSRVRLARVELRRGLWTVHNFTVEGTHTYFAGGVWVHNADCPAVIDNVDDLTKVDHGGPGHRSRIIEAATPWVKDGWPVKVNRRIGDGTAYRPDVVVLDPIEKSEPIYLVEVESTHPLDPDKIEWLNSTGLPWELFK